jgi:tetratricopeptide (TPR) repeat protein
VLQAGDSDAALEILEGAFDLYAHDGAYLTQLSRAQLAAGNLTNALASAELAVEIDPRHEGAFEALREAASSTGKWLRAISLLRTLTSQEPLETGHWFKLALLGLGSERRELTRQALAGALCVDRRDPALLARAGEILAVLGEKRSAFRLLGKAARLAPENPDYLVDFALKGEDLAEWDTSLGAWLDLQYRRPDDTRAILGIARCLTAQGRTDEAILKLQAGLEDDPGTSDLFLALAKALLDDNRKLAAVDLLSRAHRRFQNDAEVTKSAGLLMLSNGPAESALEILKAAVRLQPYDKDVLIATADCCSRLGMFEESVRILRAVSSDQESSALASALFATAALQAGDDQAVNEALRCCLDAQPSTEREFELLTEALLRLGDWERAAAHAKSWHARHRSEASIRALIRLHLRLADAHWLFTQLSKATHHGPSVQWVGEGSRADLATLLAAAEEIGLSDNQMELFEAHRILSFEAPAEQQFAQCEELLLLQPAPEVIESLALAHLRSGDAMHCIRILSSELAAPLQLEWAPLLQGIAYRQQGDYEIADLQLDESRGRSMLRPYASFQAAVSSYEQGEISIAISRLNEALSICPKEPAWHHLLGRLYRQGDELDAALPHFQRACELAPAESEYALSLARAYRALGQPVAAVEIYAGMLKASAGESDLWREAGQVCLEAEDYHRAGEYFQRAVDISPADPIALIGYAQAAGAVGQNRFARDLAQKALRASPRDPQVLVGLAGLLRSEGKLAAALDVYAKAIDLSGDPLAVRLDRADLLAEAGETDQAIADLQMAAGERPENDQIWGALARALEKAGRFEPAQEAISRAVSIAPRNVNHRLQLARLCRKSGQLDRALHELAELKASAGLDYRLPVEMGRVYEARRDHSSALRWYQQAISQNPHNAEAYYRAGYVLKALKAYPQAGKMLKRAVDLDPKNTEAHHQLAAVRALELVHYTINSPVGSI